MMEVTTANVLINVTSTIVPELIKHGSVTFSWYDYILFVLMLGFSGAIGIYFGCFGSKQSTTNEYLMGGKQMKVIPVAVSLVASHTSGITLLALPADVYKYGGAYWLGSFSMILLAFITVYVYLPIFYNLQITSTYEYLERRFDVRTRLCASFLFALSLIVYLPIVIYIPALAFAAATGLDLHVIAAVVCGVCIFYTTIGGLKAVVWTDTLQFTVTIGAVLTVLFLGARSSGGFGEVWSKVRETGHLDIFDFSPDPTRRESFWAILIGLTIHWVGHTSVNQGCVQKFLSVPTLRDAKKTVYYYCIGMLIPKTISVLTGFIMVKMYSSCDPFTTKEVQKNDQLLPYYVMDVAGHIPGLPGLFIAGVVCAALSTLSANLNCLAGSLYEDFVSKCLPKNTSEAKTNVILKTIVVVTGIVSTIMVFIVENLGGLLNLAISLGSVAHGPLLGMFTLGVLFPRANGHGAFFGALTSMVFMAMMIFGTKYYQQSGMLKYPHKPLSVDGCKFFVNSTVAASLNSTTTDDAAFDAVPFVFKISFYYFTMIGAIIVIIVGLTISYATKKQPVKKELISPVIHFMLDDEESTTKANGLIEYYPVTKALKMVNVESGCDEKKELISPVIHFMLDDEESTTKANGLIEYYPVTKALKMVNVESGCDEKKEYS